MKVVSSQQERVLVCHLRSALCALPSRRSGKDTLQFGIAKSFLHDKKDLCIHDCCNPRGRVSSCLDHVASVKLSGYTSSFLRHCSSTCSIIKCIHNCSLGPSGLVSKSRSAIKIGSCWTKSNVYRNYSMRSI